MQRSYAVFQSVPLPCILAVLLWGTASARAQTFPEVSQLPPHAELPDPLVMLDGSRVTTPEQWRRQRRPELQALFQHYMYGYLPAAPETYEVDHIRVDSEFLGGKATMTEFDILFDPPGTTVIRLLLVVPNGRRGLAPVFLALNSCGNYALVDAPTVFRPSGWLPENCPGCEENRATEAGRGRFVSNWAIEKTIDRGYAVATFYNGDVDPDRPDFTDGVHPHYFRKGQTKPGPHDWGTIAAWAWGLHRAVDYLYTDDGIDSNRIAVVGHSRRGKTALLAAALDERIDLVIPHQAGCGGTSLSRSQVGESVKQINDRFPHWFNDTFPAFNDRVELLPFDQHSLIALVAPRPVLLTNAVEDTWADPDGQFRALQAAEPVYQLLGAGGLEADQVPELGRLVDSKLGYYIREGKHSLTSGDWDVFLNYADKRFGPPRKP
jgi:hypothetical protein